MNLSFPSFFDNTSLKAFRSCEKRGFFYFHEKLVSTDSSVHLIAGGAFAKALEETRKSFFLDGKHFQEALSVGSTALLLEYGSFETHLEAKSPDRMLGALDYYFKQFPIDKGLIPYISAEGKHGIEFNFAVPLPLKNPVTNEPLLYVGRCDMIGVDGNFLAVEDDKTTSQLGKTWESNWPLSSQLFGYAWACHQTGIEVNGAVVRGISLLKNGYGSAEVTLSVPPWKISRWYDNTLLTITRIIECWHKGKWIENWGSSCTEYGKCPYDILCDTSEPEGYKPIYFKEQTWNPLL